MTAHRTIGDAVTPVETTPNRPRPWELTLEEFSARGGYCPPALEAEIDTARTVLQALRRDVEALEQQMLAAAGHWVKRRVPDLATRRTILGALAEHQVRDVTSALRSPKVSPDLKAAYRVKAKELAAVRARFEDRYCHEALHRRIVEDALAAGLAIPSNVLAQYPQFFHVPWLRARAAPHLRSSPRPWPCS